MGLKPQDVLVLLKLGVRASAAPWTYSLLGIELGMSPSEVHAAVGRAEHVGLLGPGRAPVRAALLEFLLHGLKYVFPAERGAITRGMPTAHAAAPLAAQIAPDELPPVWPDPAGDVRGEEFKPLYRSAPVAARRDERLYQCLALVDALRGGRARERKLAEKLLTEMLAA